jgi:hypothetical protein
MTWQTHLLPVVQLEINPNSVPTDLCDLVDQIPILQPVWVATISITTGNEESTPHGIFLGNFCVSVKDRVDLLSISLRVNNVFPHANTFFSSNDRT